MPCTNACAMVEQFVSSLTGPTLQQLLQADCKLPPRLQLAQLLQWLRADVAVTDDSSRCRAIGLAPHRQALVWILLAALLARDRLADSEKQQMSLLVSSAWDARHAMPCMCNTLVSAMAARLSIGSGATTSEPASPADNMLEDTAGAMLKPAHAAELATHGFCRALPPTSMHPVHLRPPTPCVQFTR